MSDLKILITGGLGYIGGRIADSLKRNIPDATIILGSRRKLSQFPSWAQSFQKIQLDNCDPVSVQQAVANTNTIIHLACLNENNSLSNIQSAWETNALGTENLLSIAEKNGIQKFIYFSIFIPSLCRDPSGCRRYDQVFSAL